MPCSPAQKGLITRIQKYATKDGPGIRSTVFMKGCPLGCLWCANPEAISSKPEILVHAERCTSCGQCMEKCPQGAIFLEEGKYRIDRSLCTSCGRCVEVCAANVYEKTGSLYTIDALVDELKKDKVFYDASGGGVTFSGGDPLMYPEFIRCAAEKLKENQIHVALETAGYAQWEVFESLLGVIDLVLLDIKFFDPQAHKKYTGISNKIILDNAQKLSAAHMPLVLRFIYIPGINDGKDLMDRIAFAIKLKNVKQIDILKYHKLGIGKYNKLGKKYLLEDINEPEDTELQEAIDFAKQQGLLVTVGG